MNQNPNTSSNHLQTVFPMIKAESATLAKPNGLLVDCNHFAGLRPRLGTYQSFLCLTI